MTAREKDDERGDIDAGIYSRLAAPIPTNLISWRIDGKAIEKNGKWVARFVAYIEANTVRERLDAVVPGEWDETLEALPSYTRTNKEGEAVGTVFAFKCRLQVLGVMREDVGQGVDYKAAATDAFKRAAVRFGVGHELYSYEQNWVQVDGPRYPVPVEDPNDVYARRQARKGGGVSGAERGAAVNRGTAGVAPSPAAPRAAAPRTATPPNGMPPIGVAIPTFCPKCEGDLYDNRAKKASGAFSSKAPDFKCKDKSCDTPIWLDAKKSSGKPGPKGEHTIGDLPGEYDETQALEEEELPF